MAQELPRLSKTRTSNLSRSAYSNIRPASAYGSFGNWGLSPVSGHDSVHRSMSISYPYSTDESPLLSPSASAFKARPFSYVGPSSSYSPNLFRTVNFIDERAQENSQKSSPAEQPNTSLSAQSQPETLKIQTSGLDSTSANTFYTAIQNPTPPADQETSQAQSLLASTTGSSNLGGSTELVSDSGEILKTKKEVYEQPCGAHSTGIKANSASINTDNVTSTTTTTTTPPLSLLSSTPLLSKTKGSIHLSSTRNTTTLSKLLAPELKHSEPTKNTDPKLNRDMTLSLNSETLLVSQGLGPMEKANSNGFAGSDAATKQVSSCKNDKTGNTVLADSFQYNNGNKSSNSAPKPLTNNRFSSSSSNSTSTISDSTVLKSNPKTSNKSDSSRFPSTLVENKSSTDKNKEITKKPEQKEAEEPTQNSKAPKPEPLSKSQMTASTDPIRESVYLNLNNASSYESHPSRSNWKTTSHVIESLQSTIDKLKRELQVQQTRCDEEKTSRAALQKRCTQLETQQSGLHHQCDTLNSVLERKERRQRENERKLKECQELVEQLEKEQSVYIKEKVAREKDVKQTEAEAEKMKIEYTVMASEVKRKKEVYESMMKKMVDVLKEMGINEEDKLSLEEMVKNTPEVEVNTNVKGIDAKGDVTKNKNKKKPAAIHIKRVSSPTPNRPSSPHDTVDGINVIASLKQLQSQQAAERSYILSLHTEMQVERAKHVSAMAAMEKAHQERLKRVVDEHAAQMKQLLSAAQDEAQKRESEMENKVQEVLNMVKMVGQGQLSKLMAIKEREDAMKTDL